MALRLFRPISSSEAASNESLSLEIPGAIIFVISILPQRLGNESTKKSFRMKNWNLNYTISLDTLFCNQNSFCFPYHSVFYKTKNKETKPHRNCHICKYNPFHSCLQAQETISRWYRGVHFLEFISGENVPSAFVRNSQVRVTPLWKPWNGSAMHNTCIKRKE